MNPRQRRLIADSQGLRTEFAGHRYVTVTPVGFDPAEEYRVVFRVRGVILGPSGQPAYSDHHEASIRLPSGYPRTKPVATMLTPIFHPNFGPALGDEICIGDYWSPTQSLSDIVVTIGELIQYQRYNTRSPLNAAAARWAAENEHIFPVGTVGLFQSEPDVTVAPVPDSFVGLSEPVVDQDATMEGI